jgi:hypothetical protein
MRKREKRHRTAVKTGVDSLTLASAAGNRDADVKEEDDDADEEEADRWGSDSGAEDNCRSVRSAPEKGCPDAGATPPPATCSDTVPACIALAFCFSL